MIRKYELRKRLGVETLFCRIYRNGESFPCITMYVRTDFRSVVIEPLPSVSIIQVNDELFRIYSFLDSPHWRDSLAKSPQYDSLFETMEIEYL